MVCVDNKYAGVILHNEYFTELNIGDKLTLNVINIYEDDKLGLSPRQSRKEELDILEKSIMNYLEGADGHMRFNDKSTPEELVTVFNTSKKNFKRALGVPLPRCPCVPPLSPSWWTVARPRIVESCNGCTGY